MRPGPATRSTKALNWRKTTSSPDAGANKPHPQDRAENLITEIVMLIVILFDHLHKEKPSIGHFQNTRNPTH